jgi:hypothetical protein
MIKNFIIPLPDIVRVTKPRRMRWVGHVERLRVRRIASGFLVGETGRKRQRGRYRPG